MEPRSTTLGGTLKRRLDDAFHNALRDRTREQIAKVEAGQNAYGFDPFGFKPDFLTYLGPPIEFLYYDYFRVEVFGIENLPPSGRVLLIANHSGQLPFDAMMIGAATLFEPDPPRAIRSMIERWVPEIPFVSWIFARAGAATGTRDNARKLIEQESCILVFPEGVRGISKTYDRAYELAEFGLGFMRLALETQTPIVPIGVVGAEEQFPAVYNAERVGALLGAPALPLSPIMLPLPVKYRIYFGEPLYFSGNPDDEDRVVGAQVARVKDAIGALLQRGLHEREGIFW